MFGGGWDAFESLVVPDRNLAASKLLVSIIKGMGHDKKPTLNVAKL